MEKEGQNKVKIIIVVLSILLAISLCALAGTIIYNKLISNSNQTVTVPDNLISPYEETTVYKEQNSKGTDTTSATSNNSKDKTKSDNIDEKNTKENKKDEVSSKNVTNNDSKKANSIKLFNKKPEDNEIFMVTNMFPGDSITKYFCVQVSYQNIVNVHFGTEVQKGYEKLAEVMNIRIKLLDTNEVLYDGKVGDMPKSVFHQLKSVDEVTDELYYSITVYLDTSVGNSYQNKKLVMDFQWWVQDAGNLRKAPKTFDDSQIILLAAIAITSAILCVVLLYVNRNREGHDEEI